MNSTDTNQEVRETPEALNGGYVLVPHSTLAAALQKMELSADIIRRNLSHQREKVEDARSICIEVAETIRSAMLQAALASAPPPAVPDAVRVKVRDWREVARLAGEHGIRYRTNRALERFLAGALSSIEPTPSPELQAADALVDMERRKDAAYEERNKVVAALAKLFPSGLCKTDIPGWSHDWHGCVRVDLPTGQVSWHYHDSQAHLFADLPPYQSEWDGHDTQEKYRRLAALSPEPQASNAGAVKPLKLRCTDEWLKRHIEADADYDVEAGGITTPEPQTGERDTVSYAAGFEAGGRIERERGDALEELLEAERTSRKAAERRLTEVEKRAREDERDWLAALLKDGNFVWCDYAHAWLTSEEGAMLPADRAALRAKPEAQAIVGKEAGE